MSSREYIYRTGTPGTEAFFMPQGFEANVEIHVWGAGGGDGTGAKGAGGGYAKSTVQINAGDFVEIVVGSQGRAYPSAKIGGAGGIGSSTLGFNGGRGGDQGDPEDGDAGSGGGGGAATAVLINGVPVAVGAGGGGGGGYGEDGAGGATPGRPGGESIGAATFTALSVIDPRTGSSANGYYTRTAASESSVGSARQYIVRLRGVTVWDSGSRPPSIYQPGTYRGSVYGISASGSISPSAFSSPNGDNLNAFDLIVNGISSWNTDTNGQNGRTGGSGGGGGAGGGYPYGGAIGVVYGDDQQGSEGGGGGQNYGNVTIAGSGTLGAGKSTTYYSTLPVPYIGNAGYPGYALLVLQRKYNISVKDDSNTWKDVDKAFVKFGSTSTTSYVSATKTYSTAGSDIFKVPTGVTSLSVTVVGGAGGGAGTAGSTKTETLTVAPNDNINLTVGVGGGAGGSATTTYTSTARTTYTVPTGVTSISITATGGAGGAGADNTSPVPQTFAGLTGAIISGTLSVNAGDVIAIYVGGGGGYGSAGTIIRTGGAGGISSKGGTYNGGAGATTLFGSYNAGFGGGGAATVIELNGAVVAVATGGPGGAGGGYNYSGAGAGHGGGPALVPSGWSSTTGSTTGRVTITVPKFATDGSSSTFGTITASGGIGGTGAGTGSAGSITVNYTVGETVSPWKEIKQIWTKVDGIWKSILSSNSIKSLAETTTVYTSLITNEFVVPAGCTRIYASLTGGGGGGGGYDSPYAGVPGFSGSVVSGVYAVTPGDVITIGVGGGGGRGGPGTGTGAGVGGSSSLGFGGGRGGNPGGSGWSGGGGGGGAASVLKLNGTVLAVAAGGGGGGGGGNHSAGIATKPSYSDSGQYYGTAGQDKSGDGGGAGGGGGGYNGGAGGATYGGDDGAYCGSDGADLLPAGWTSAKAGNQGAAYTNGQQGSITISYYLP